MVNLIRMKLVNFVGIKLGMDLDEIEIDRTKSDNNIILLIGDNGSGKSSLMMEMTPIPLEHIGARNKSRIVPDKIGVKELDYLVDGYVLYKIKIIYDPKKTTKCYITKVIDGKEIDLNPNGNVESYLEVVEHELHMKKSYTNVGYLCGNGENKNFVAMQPTERNNYISEWMPEISDFLDAYRLSTKILSKLKRDIDSYNKQIGTMSSINYELELSYLNSNIENVSRSIKELEMKMTQLRTYNEQIFKGVKSANELETLKLRYLKTLKLHKEKYNNFLNTYKNLSQIKFSSKDDFDENYKKLSKRVSDEQHLINHLQETLNIISSEISSTEALLNPDEKISNTDLQTIHSTIDMNNDLLKSIDESINNTINNYPNIEFMSNETYNELKSFISILDEKFRQLNDVVPMESIKDMDNLTKVIEDNEESLVKLSDLINNKQTKLTFINNEIYKYEHGNLDTEILMKRPEFCKDHKCGIVEEILKYLNPKDNVKELYSEAEGIVKEINEYSQTKTTLENSIKNLRNGYGFYANIQDFLYKNNDLVSKLPNMLSEFILKDPSSIYIHMNEIKMLIPEIYEYSTLVTKKDDISKSIEDLNNLMKLVTTNTQIQQKLDKLNKEYSETKNKYEESVLDYTNDNQTLKLYEDYEFNIRKRDEELEQLMYENKNLRVLKHNILEYSKCTYVYQSNKYYLENVLNKQLIDLQSELNQMNSKRDEMTTFTISKRQIEKMRNEVQEKFNRINILNKIWSPKVGYPSLKINKFLNDLTIKTNEDLKAMWGSDIKIEKFEPTATEFNIRINKQGNTIKDASLCSQGETQTINTAISFSIIESGIDAGGYDVLRLDEVDGAFDEKRRMGFMDIIQNRVNEMGCDSCFIITHNGEFEDIPCDIIILKGAKIPEAKLQNKNILFRY